MIKAIIFDCFGVLAAEGWKPFCMTHFGISNEKRHWAEELMQEVSRGERTSEQMADEMQKATGVAPEEFLAMLHTNPPNVELFAYIETLKPDYKIGFLSNVGHNRMEELFTAEQIALFDSVVLSYALSMSKPQPEIYQHAIEQLGVAAEECVFIDDSKNYCDGAEAVGMQTIQYKDFPQCQREVNALLGV